LRDLFFSLLSGALELESSLSVIAVVSACKVI